MRKYRAIALMMTAALALALGGCGSESETDSEPTAAAQTPVATPSATSPAPMPSEAPEPPAQPRTAVEVAAQLQGVVPTIAGITEVTEDNDSNGLIGRPGQYTSAAWIADSSAVPGETGIDGGAVVEVFASAEDAQARSNYVQETLKNLGPAFGTEYHYLDGEVLLRVSGVLMPSQASLYESAFRS